MNTDFEGSVVLITGGTSGIGEAAAFSFSESGARVILSGRNVERGDAVAHEIGEHRGSAEFVGADLRLTAEVECLFATIRRKYGRLDCAFNAAGGETVVAPIVEQSRQHFDDMVAVDLRGTWLCMQSELRMMIDQGSGAIVNCSAVAGLKGSPGSAIYAACKHGILGMTKSAALECADSNIRVNAVCPGIVQTPSLDRVFGNVPGFTLEEARLWGVQQIPMKRFAQPEEVASAVLWLCSDAASYLTGHSMIVDAGVHCA